MSKLQPSRTTVNSIRTSQRPRVTRKRLTSAVPRAWLLRPCAPYRKAEMPARKMKVGAQKCVTQRVRNSAVSVTSRGLKPPLAKKSRVWSRAITIITRPRSVSIELRRVRSPTAATFIEDTSDGEASGNAVRCDASSVTVMTVIRDQRFEISGRGARMTYRGHSLKMRSHHNIRAGNHGNVRKRRAPRKPPVIQHLP